MNRTQLLLASFKWEMRVASEPHSPTMRRRGNNLLLPLLAAVTVLVAYLAAKVLRDDKYHLMIT